MKTTLVNSYCRPTIEEGLRLLKYNEWTDDARADLKERISCEPFIVFLNGKRFAFRFGKSRKEHEDVLTEIPVQHFIDLVEDKTYSLFRLIESGFHNSAFDYYDMVIPKQEKIWRITVGKNGTVTLNGELTNCDTFTDLLTLIRFLK